MKNLIHIPIENIPPINAREYKIKRRYQWYKNQHWEGHKVRGIRPHDRVRRLLQKNVGEPFNDVFSYYCTLVPKYQQKYFLEEFENRRYYRYWNSYYTDDEGIIRVTRKQYRQTGLIIPSKDAKYEDRHKIYGIPRPNTTNWWKWHWENHQKIHHCIIHGMRLNLRDSDFVRTLVQGSEIRVKSKNDPRYGKYHAEREKARRKEDRRFRRESLTKAYTFITKSERELKEEKLKNNYNILRHGFDLVTSFRTDKQTNPDLIHLSQ